MDKYFYCYSYPLKEFLLSNGQVSIVAGIHPNTHKKYWVFNGTKQLNNLLTEWKLRKH
jgi:hypothetical protein|nr:MAG TPA: hypothetical protein [Caudoviricetes sp.]